MPGRPRPVRRLQRSARGPDQRPIGQPRSSYRAGDRPPTPGRGDGPGRHRRRRSRSCGDHDHGLRGFDRGGGRVGQGAGLSQLAGAGQGRPHRAGHQRGQDVHPGPQRGSHLDGPGWRHRHLAGAVIDAGPQRGPPDDDACCARPPRERGFRGFARRHVHRADRQARPFRGA